MVVTPTQYPACQHWKSCLWQTPTCLLGTCNPLQALRHCFLEHPTWLCPMLLLVDWYDDNTKQHSFEDCWWHEVPRYTRDYYIRKRCCSVAPTNNGAWAQHSAYAIMLPCTNLAIACIDWHFTSQSKSILTCHRRNMQVILPYMKVWMWVIWMTSRKDHTFIYTLSTSMVATVWQWGCLYVALTLKAFSLMDGSSDVSNSTFKPSRETQRYYHVTQASHIPPLYLYILACQIVVELDFAVHVVGCGPCLCDGNASCFIRVFGFNVTKDNTWSEITLSIDFKRLFN